MRWREQAEWPKSRTSSDLASNPSPGLFDPRGIQIQRMHGLGSSRKARGMAGASWAGPTTTSGAGPVSSSLTATNPGPASPEAHSASVPCSTCSETSSGMESNGGAAGRPATRQGPPPPPGKKGIDRHCFRSPGHEGRTNTTRVRPHRKGEGLLLRHISPTQPAAGRRTPIRDLWDPLPAGDR